MVEDKIAVQSDILCLTTELNKFRKQDLIEIIAALKVPVSLVPTCVSDT